MQESIFAVRDGGFVPSAHGRGPWDASALHGGAPAALIAREFAASAAEHGLRVARMGFEFLRPVPFAPLTLELTTVRPGRRVRELAAQLSCEGQPVCRANALLLTAVPRELPGPGAERSAAMPAPDAAEPVHFSLDGDTRASFAATGIEMRSVDGDPRTPGPARVWIRLRRALVDGEDAVPLARLAAAADFGNGVSAALPFERYLFINADLHVHLWRAPQGEWIGLDARTVLSAGGTGLAESVLHDERGALGRAFQSLVVAPRDGDGDGDGAGAGAAGR